MSLLVGNDGSIVGLRALVVARELYAAVIVVVAARRTLVPLVESTGTTFHVILRTVIPGPAATYRRAAVNLGGVVSLHALHPFVAVTDPVAGWLIAGSHHQERRVVTKLINNTPRLFEQVFINLHTLTQLHAVIRPRGAFWLQVDTHLVGSSKGSLRRAIAMKAHVVQSVLLDFAEDFNPRGLVRRRVARLGEAAVLDRSTKKELPSVNIYLPATDADVAKSEDDLVVIVACLQNQLVEVGIELIPLLGVLRQRELQHLRSVVDALSSKAQWFCASVAI